MWEQPFHRFHRCATHIWINNQIIIRTYSLLLMFILYYIITQVTSQIHPLGVNKDNLSIKSFPLLIKCSRKICLISQDPKYDPSDPYVMLWLGTFVVRFNLFVQFPFSLVLVCWSRCWVKQKFACTTVCRTQSLNAWSETNTRLLEITICHDFRRRIGPFEVQ